MTENQRRQQGEHKPQEPEDVSPEDVSPEDVSPEDERPELHSKDVMTDPVGRGGSLAPRHLPEEVDEASDESFPASDPPGWTAISVRGGGT